MVVKGHIAGHRRKLQEGFRTQESERLRSWGWSFSSIDKLSVVMLNFPEQTADKLVFLQANAVSYRKIVFLQENTLSCRNAISCRKIHILANLAERRCFLEGPNFQKPGNYPHFEKKSSRSEKAILGATLGIPGHSRSNSRNGTLDLIYVKTLFSEQLSERLSELVGRQNFNPNSRSFFSKLGWFPARQKLSQHFQQRNCIFRATESPLKADMVRTSTIVVSLPHEGVRPTTLSSDPSYPQAHLNRQECKKLYHPGWIERKIFP